MKKTYIFLCMLFIACISFQSSAQVNPGTTNLKHQWTFDDGTGKDLVGTVNGVLEGAATFASKALSTVNGGFMSFSGADIAINTYPEVTQEIWFTSSSGVNGGCTMLSYFGNTTGSFGTDYVFVTAAGCTNARTAISCGVTSNPWTAENGVNGARIDDGKMHQLVAILDATGISFYIDGVFQGTKVDYTGTNSISALSTTYAYLCKGGYTGDPTWKGFVNKFSIYNKALSAEEILYLFQKGGEEQPVITTDYTALAFDNHYPAQAIKIAALNLINPIAITAPAGISVQNYAGSNVTSLPATTKSDSLIVIWDTTTPVDGKITLSSGTTVVDLAVKTASDATCYLPLYNDVQNIFEEFTGMNRLSDFQGWGTKGVSTIINDPANVYCGAASISVGNGIAAGTGSLDIKGGVAAVLLPNTTYRVKLMVKTIGGTFHLGVDAGPNIEFTIDTKGEWMPLDTVFTTGATLGANMYFNNYACTGLIAYVDNFEIYVYSEPIINVNTTAIGFDPETALLSTFNVTSSNLKEDIILTAPTGISLGSNILPAESAGLPVEVIWDGVTPVNGYITLQSGTLTVKVLVNALTASNSTCFTKLYPDLPNLVSDPYMSDLANFAGWGAKSINMDPANVYCGSRSGLISGGSIDVLLTGLLSDNTTYRARAMVKATSTNLNFGIYGWSTTKGDSVSHPTVLNEWTPIELVFTTETLRAAYGLFFNNAPGSYIDNWELYQIPADAIPMINTLKTKIFVQNGRIVAEFELPQTSNVEFAVYNMQGALMSTDKLVASGGKTIKQLNAKVNSGVYIVKMTVDGKSSYSKVIK